MSHQSLKCVRRGQRLVDTSYDEELKVVNRIYARTLTCCRPRHAIIGCYFVHGVCIDDKDDETPEKNLMLELSATFHYVV